MVLAVLIFSEGFGCNLNLYGLALTLSRARVPFLYLYVIFYVTEIMYNYTVFEIQLPANLPKKMPNFQFLALLFQNQYLPK